MSKISRVTAKLFGSGAGLDQIAQFGSLAAGSANFTTNPATIQALSEWLDGWFSAVIGGNSPAIEDMNAFCYVMAYQICYAFQEGVAEWDSGTTYYIGSVVNSSGRLYVSITDTNLNNAVTDTANWYPFNNFVNGTSAVPVSVGGATAVPVRANTNQDVYIQGNATVWTARTQSSSQGWHSVAWAGSLGLFAAVGETLGAGSIVMTSPDGITWQGRTPAQVNVWAGVAWSPALGIFAAVSKDGTNRSMYSTDGINWSAGTIPSHRWESVCWSPKLGLFAAVNQDGSGTNAATSTDGITFTGRAATATDWTSVCWSEELSLFVAVALAGANRVMTSPDGITWTAGTAAAANTWNSVVWGADAGVFVAVSSGASVNNQIMYSADGFAWTIAASPNDDWQSVAYSDEMGLFVAVGSTNHLTAWSIDGITWTSLSSAAASAWDTVTWSPDLEIFVAIANVAAASQVQTLPLTKISANPQIAAGSFENERLRLIGASNINQVKLVNGNGLYLKSAALQMKKYIVADFFWDNNALLWVEV